MSGRPRNEVQGFKVYEPVKVSSKSQFRGYKLGLVQGPCKYKDGGITVLMTSESSADESVYRCIQIERGDTIVSIEKK